MRPHPNQRSFDVLAYGAKVCICFVAARVILSGLYWVAGWR